MSDVQEFMDLVKDFEEITAEEAESKLVEENGSIVFLGRATCPFCRKFAPKLHQVSQDEKLEVYFVNSEDPNQAAELKSFRDKYNLATVPSLLVSAGDEVKVRSDSSMSIEEISSFVQV